MNGLRGAELLGGKLPIKKLSNKLIENFPALKYKYFRYFLAGQCVSLMGTWIQRTAQQWVFYSITKSAFLLGILGVFQFTPMLLFSLFAGVFVDRFPKKKLLLITQFLQMLQAFVFAILILSGHIKYWHVLILAGIYGIVQTFDMPTRQSFFIELVGKEDLISAIGMNSTIVNIARILGPAISGIILLKLGPVFCFAINGFSFIAVMIGLMSIKSYQVNIRKQNCNIIKDIIDGLKYIKSQKVILTSVILMLIVGTFAFNNEVIIPVYVKEVLHKSAGVYSTLLTASGIGALIGSVKFASNKKRRSNVIFTSALILSMCLIIQGFIHTYYISILILTAYGFFNIIFMASVNSTIQINSSDEYRGRAVSVYSLVLVGTTPIGNLFAGTVGQYLGANMSFLSCGIITLVLMSIMFFYLKRV
ncbi:major facilitator superfamily protein [Clostridium pasteurianum DSM 525 = ATCC 6013]|uniref:Major facilitator superfamily protein n=1 Tax=Clostridium pasteurianum DSM 525 = ATCC 6013 TaxID=1262449 RepID=A0A0H3J2Y0_CLOPA|nr:MFS transporter [Clostridium pasteurianum]AJA47147.1 major facilitator superfamily protein [Clostridium pasteurianum DSM 525 = ATCC 6013]AJA51135.1 major facilitator superfamily protein [Clostridium pasteurianum DSM 525 = ATCC 6013]AOZ74507.1 MFS transporter [Clostridium pasteurianum DSM 525 = ATCC 6013]AOZ78304.1 MFS transporter [Clostridium pasteurianum]ELP59465.1 major facilitator superfamily protein [Clostridium pasteurianum DSM 525 = ATCC 6013]